jgi:hypothetical protein
VPAGLILDQELVVDELGPDLPPARLADFEGCGGEVELDARGVEFVEGPSGVGGEIGGRRERLVRG